MAVEHEFPEFIEDPEGPGRAGESRLGSPGWGEDPVGETWWMEMTSMVRT